MRFLDNQSVADTSLALFTAINEWQRVFLVKHELSRVFLVSKIFIQ